MDTKDIVIGRTRVRDAAGYRGTVLYVGPVASASATTSSSSDVPPGAATDTSPAESSTSSVTDTLSSSKANKATTNAASATTANTTNTTIYAGIEWDDASRGKHDGTVLVNRTTGERVRYFSTRHASGTSGSFVKIQKLDWGVALTYDVLQTKYVDAETSTECVAPRTLLPHTAQTVSGRNDKAIQLLGEMQIRQRQQLSQLSTLSLRHQGIASLSTTPNEVEQLSDHLQHVRDIDLAGNLLCDWTTIEQLLSALPLLTRLGVASNYIGDWKSSVNHPNERKIGNDLVNTTWQHSNLLHLNLHDTRIQSVDTILCIGRAFPNLTELILANNGRAMDDDYNDDGDSSPPTSGSDNPHQPMPRLATQLAQAFTKLTFLDCSQCQGLFGSTRYGGPNALVQAWSQLPQLQVLSIDDNPGVTDFAKSKTADNNDTDIIFYPALCHLQVSGTALADWTVVSSWHVALPHLTRLRLSSCPTLSRHQSTAVIRRCLLYLLPNVTLLNGSAVTELERRDAVRLYYQRLALQPWMSTSGSSTTVEGNMTGNSSDSINNSNPFAIQDEHWLAVYPELASVAMARMSGGTRSPTSTVETGGMGSLGATTTDTATTDFDVVNVTIQSFAASSCTMPPLIRRLPSHMTVHKVKALCARQFGLDIDLQELRFRRHDSDAILEAMDGGINGNGSSDDTCTLHDYGVPDGACIVMHERDVAALALQEQRAAIAMAEQAQQQERERMDFSRRQKLAK